MDAVRSLMPTEGDGAPRQPKRRGGQRKIKARLRALECAKGVLEGKTYQQVADEQGYASRGTVHRIVHETLAQHEVEAIEELRSLELARLDAIHSSFFDAALSGDVRAAQVVLKVSAARCRLLQLDRAMNYQPEESHPVMVGGSKDEFIAALSTGQGRSQD